MDADWRESGLTEFEWLAGLDKSHCFTACDAACPAKSSDFGADGYTASLTDWHELLQLTAPDETYGLVFLRGQFPNTPDAILARAQRRDDTGSKGTLGPSLQPAQLGTDLELGERRAQGWINFKWPYSRYDLKRENDIWDAGGGTLEQISFIRAGTFFHILRLQWGRPSSGDDFASAPSNYTVRLKAGGIVQIGCPCSNGGPANRDAFTLSSSYSNSKLSCVSDWYQKRLDMRLFIDGAAQDLTPSLTRLGMEEFVIGNEIDVSSIHTIEMTDNHPVFIVSTYALRNADENDETSITTHLSEIEDYLGISNGSLNMTDRMWTALCSPNYEAGEAIEVSVIARCVEQIISVAAIPFDDHCSEDDRSQKDGIHETALISNIMSTQHVDVQSAFFQIRLLVKVYNFVETRRFEPDLLERYQPLDSIRASFLHKLVSLIRSSLTWLLNTDLKPGKLLLAVRSGEDSIDPETHSSERLAHCEYNRIFMTHDRSSNQACYPILAVWYVMRHCPQAMTDTFKSEILLPKLSRAFGATQNRGYRDKEWNPKNDVLQWFHFSCLYLICNEDFPGHSNGEAVNGFTASGLDPRDVLMTQQRSEKYVGRMKTSQIETYSVEHEEFERVILLVEELGFNALPTQMTASLGSSRAYQIRRWLAARERTMSFNRSPVLSRSRVTSNGPWELLALNHQSFLRIADDANVKPARDRLFEFMMADYSFMTSWDHADSKMVGKWWDQEPASVISATLIDLKLEGKLKSAISDAVLEDSNGTLEDLFTSPETMPEDSIQNILLQIKQTLEESSRDQLLQLRQLLAQKDAGSELSSKSFDWMTCKPGRIFHPSWWVQSLSDSPGFYRAKKTKDVPLWKDLTRYLVALDREREDSRAHAVDNIYTTETINRRVPPEEVQFLSVFDISLTSIFTFEAYHASMKTRDAPNGLQEITTTSRTPPIKEEQASAVYSRSELASYQKILFDRLNDSLVDLGAKHRILYVVRALSDVTPFSRDDVLTSVLSCTEYCTPALVNAFINVWHPDALDAFDNYFGSTSVFTEHREAAMWTTNITITYWSIRPTSLSKDNAKRFQENRISGLFPPPIIAQSGISNKQGNPFNPILTTDTVEECSSSLVITGDLSGHLWICSVWSSLTDSEAMSVSVQSLLQVLGQFVNQQVCSRCLAFLILLGHLCEKLAAEYERILSRLDVILGLGEIVLLEGLAWGGTSEAVDKLKSVLWGLEALRVFDGRLSASLGQIQKAREAMERTVKQEAGQQHVDLLDAYDNVLEEFQKRYEILSDVETRTQLKIRQVTGLRDGMSTVANVEDSQTALRDSKTTIKQGNNIRILTYITIAYLPLGFVTGLFSISHATFMDRANDVVFAVLVVFFVLGTYALALSLEKIIDSFSRIVLEGRGRKGPGTSARSAETSNRDDDELDASSLGGFCGLRMRNRRRGEDVIEKISLAA